MKDQYFFGQSLAKRIDRFAFPRTGSHFFAYCTQGLFDLVALENPALNNPEAVGRQQELDAQALYALDLREDGVPHAPVLFDARVTGIHGLPAWNDRPVVVLIRDPMATLFSLYKVNATRWNMGGGGVAGNDLSAWIATNAHLYHDFYTAAFDIIQAHPAPRETLLIRYEHLKASPAPLEALVSLVGVRPKLTPAFVHWVTRFDRFARATAPDGGERTFYRAADNEAWRRDPDWLAAVHRADLPDFGRFGYPSAQPAPAR
jgi:hypothetical protein